MHRVLFLTMIAAILCAEKHELTRCARRAFDALRGACCESEHLAARTDDVPPEIADFVAGGARAPRLRRGRRPLRPIPIT